MRKFGIAVLALILITSFARAQRTLDKVAAVVGGSIILQSDIDATYAQYQYSGESVPLSYKGQILRNLITQKLLSQQAIIDSIIVKDDEVDNEVDRRMRTMIGRAGGIDKLEAALNRSVLQYKDELRPDTKEQLVARHMQEKITEKVNITPQDVKRFFEAIPKDSLPTYNKEVEVGEIVINPVLSKDEKEEYRQKLEALRVRIKGGTDFGQMAHIYSQDQLSALEGGDLGFQDRNGLVKEFTAMAFKLKAGDISPVFETEYGFHILQVIERRGEQVHVRHILITPAITQASLERAKAKADSIYTLITAKTGSKIDFSTAASLLSDDKETKFNGGMMLNAEDVQTRSTHIPTDKLDPQVALVVDSMKVGGISKPVLISAADGKKSYKVLYLKSVTDAHQANLAQDFPKLKEYANNDKINRTVSQWFEKKRKENFIRIDPEYQNYPQLKNWSNTNPQQTNP